MRINDKDKQNHDMLLQVSEIDHKVTKNTRGVRECRKQMDEIRKNLEVVQPYNQAKMLFETLHKTCRGSMFNRAIEHQAKVMAKLKAMAEKFEEDIEDESLPFLTNDYSEPEMPPKQEEDKQASGPPTMSFQGMGMSMPTYQPNQMPRQKPPRRRHGPPSNEGTQVDRSQTRLDKQNSVDQSETYDR